MSTTEAKKVINLERRKSMWRAAHNIVDDEEMCFEAGVMAQDVIELLDERREMAETIRKQRILLTEAERELTRTVVSCRCIRDRIQTAVTGEDDG